ncbi:MAG: hypothetical protein IPG18_03460 [Saprospiraceae bacterium]|nr:hypothetical protein [Saprospiraceae bacterium]MBK6564253.1 hypothetical protein [Saprospiraceae bacterium]MBK6782416.1 hypothetical protein [Saprospiraceae bacterium]MBK7524065.1 hypothetical protein [Saprospiraceae bacterium]MBK8852729.1 hypothetical protein [Saprospiraceae bacterium]
MKFSSSLWFFLLAVTFIFVSCKDKKGNDEKEETPLYETAEFKEFYNKFSTDSAFQMDHVVFPLDGMKAPENDTMAVKHQWQREDWKIHTTFDDANGTFSVEMLDLAGKMVIEIISDESGLFSMERRFAKLSDGWNLIYYKEMGKYK